MVKIKLLILTVLLCCTAFAQEVKVLAKTDSSNYVVGDYINYEVEITRPKNVKIIMPSVEDSIKVLEFIKKEKPTTDPSGNVDIERYKYTFSFYDSTEVLIPSIKIGYKVEGDSTMYKVSTNELYVFIDKLEINPEKEIMDVKRPLLIPYNFMILGFILLGLIILLLAAYFIYRYYKKKKALADENRPEIIIPPYEEALGSLKLLEEKELWQNGEVKQYHSEITFVLRKYFERTFNFLALEMPSSDVIDNLRNIKECNVIHDEARNFFNNADMVKFAKFVPMNSVNEEMMKQAYDILDKTKPVPVEEEKSEEVQNV